MESIKSRRDVFLAALPDAARERASLSDQIDTRLEECTRRAAAACPGFAPEPELFLPYFAERVADEGDIGAALSSIHVEDLALACAAAFGSAEALRSITQQKLPAVDAVLRRKG